MTDHTDETLKHWRQVPFNWRSENCMLALADHVRRCTGHDFGGPWRNVVMTEADAHAQVDDYGGCAAMIDTTGLAHAETPERGDILVVAIGNATVGAVCTGQGCAMRLVRGVIEIDLRAVRVLMAWKVPQCV